MSVLFLFLACIAGVCAFAFLLAAVVSFQQLDVADRRLGLLDLLLGAWLSIVRGVVVHWRQEQELRRLVYVGGACLVGAAVFGWLAFRSS